MRLYQTISPCSGSSAYPADQYKETCLIDAVLPQLEQVVALEALQFASHCLVTCLFLAYFQANYRSKRLSALLEAVA